MQLATKAIRQLLEKIPEELRAMANQHNLPMPSKVHTFQISEDKKEEELKLYDLEATGYFKPINYFVGVALDYLYNFLNNKIKERKANKTFPSYLEKNSVIKSIIDGEKELNDVKFEAIAEYVRLFMDKLYKRLILFLLEENTDEIDVNKLINGFIEKHKIDLDNEFSNAFFKSILYFICKEILSSIKKKYPHLKKSLDSSIILILSNIDGFINSNKEKLAFEKVLYELILENNKKQGDKKESIDKLIANAKQKYASSYFSINDEEIVSVFQKACIFVDIFFKQYYEDIRNNVTVPQAIGNFVFNMAYYSEKMNSEKNVDSEEMNASVENKKNAKIEKAREKFKHIYNYVPMQLLENGFAIDHFEEELEKIERYVPQQYIKTGEALDALVPDIHYAIEFLYGAINEQGDEKSLEKLIETMAYGESPHPWDQHAKNRLDTSIIKNKNHGEHVLFFMAFYNIFALLDSFLRNELATIGVTRLASILKNVIAGLLSSDKNENLNEANLHDVDLDKINTDEEKKQVEAILKPFLDPTKSTLSKLIISLNALLLLATGGKAKSSITLGFVENMIYDFAKLLGKKNEKNEFEDDESENGVNSQIEKTFYEEYEQEIKEVLAPILFESVLKISLPKVTDSFSYDFMNWFIGSDKREHSDFKKRKKSLNAFEKRGIGIIPLIKNIVVDNNKELIAISLILTTLINELFSPIFNIYNIKSHGFSLAAIDKIVVNHIYDGFITHSPFQQQLIDYNNGKCIDEDKVEEGKKQVLEQFNTSYIQKIEENDEALMLLQKDINSVAVPFDLANIENIQLLHSIESRLNNITYELNRRVPTEWIYAIHGEVPIDNKSIGFIMEGKEKIWADDFFEHFTYGIKQEKANEFLEKLNAKKSEISQLKRTFKFNTQLVKAYSQAKTELISEFYEKTTSFIKDNKDVGSKNIDNINTIKSILSGFKKEYLKVFNAIQEIKKDENPLLAKALKEHLCLDLEEIKNEIDNFLFDVDKRWLNLLLGDKDTVLKNIEENKTSIEQCIKEVKKKETDSLKLSKAVESLQKKLDDLSEKSLIFFESNNEKSEKFMAFKEAYEKKITYLNEEQEKIQYLLDKTDGQSLIKSFSSDSQCIEKVKKIKDHFYNGKNKNLLDLLKMIGINGEETDGFEQIKTFIANRKFAMKPDEKKKKVSSFLSVIFAQIEYTRDLFRETLKKNNEEIESAREEKKSFKSKQIQISDEITEKKYLLTENKKIINKKNKEIEDLKTENKSLNQLLEKINNVNTYESHLNQIKKRKDTLVKKLHAVDFSELLKDEVEEFLDNMSQVKTLITEINSNKENIQDYDDLKNLMKESDNCIQSINKVIEDEKERIAASIALLKQEAADNVEALNAKKQELVDQWNAMKEKQSDEKFSTIKGFIYDLDEQINTSIKGNAFIQWQVNLLNGTAEKMKDADEVEEDTTIIDNFAECVKEIRDETIKIYDHETAFNERKQAINILHKTIKDSLSNMSFFSKLSLKFSFLRKSSYSSEVYSKVDRPFLVEPLNNFIKNGKVSTLEIFSQGYFFSKMSKPAQRKVFDLKELFSKKP